MANLGEAARVDWEVYGEDAGGRGHEHHGAVVGDEGEPARRGDGLSMNINAKAEVRFVMRVVTLKMRSVG